VRYNATTICRKATSASSKPQRRPHFRLFIGNCLEHRNTASQEGVEEEEEKGKISRSEWAWGRPTGCKLKPLGFFVVAQVM
jgi:hypothetical protein